MDALDVDDKLYGFFVAVWRLGDSSQDVTCEHLGNLQCFTKVLSCQLLTVSLVHCVCTHPLCYFCSCHFVFTGTNNLVWKEDKGYIGTTCTASLFDPWIQKLVALQVFEIVVFFCWWCKQCVQKAGPLWPAVRNRKVFWMNVNGNCETSFCISKIANLSGALWGMSDGESHQIMTRTIEPFHGFSTNHVPQHLSPDCHYLRSL
jgi:hypothetical protein